MHEAWQSIYNFPNYMVSNKGRVCRIKHTRTDKNGKTYSIPYKVLKGTICKDGYHKVHLTSEEISRTFFVHRLVAQRFCKKPRNKRTVNHKDGNKLNNFWTNLEWMTDKENVQHAFKTGLSSNKGTKNSQCKLTEEQVIKIKKLKGLMPQSLVAEYFKISKGHVSNIQRGHNWKAL